MPPYIPGHPPGIRLPLARYLPPVPAGVAASWLEGHIPPEGLVLDPFGAAPWLDIEIARAGYRLLVAANNPITRFLLQVLATPPGLDELQAALAALAVARKGEERIEPHILSLYHTTCDHCAATISAQAFVWEKDAPAPYARLYRCPHCETEGEFPANEADKANAARFAAPGPHHARALERVLPLHDPDRAHVEAALRLYPPRALYALFTLINKLDGLPLTPYRRTLLAALLLAAFDRANALWPHPAARARPKQLSLPPRYLEHNLWMALEESIQTWHWPDQPATPLTVLPTPDAFAGAAEPGPGGITLFQGRFKDLLPALTPTNIAAVLTAIPRPNPAFWTLSALWGGWLWGPEAVGPFRSVLRRRRYGWGWHTAALHAVLRPLARCLAKDTPLFALLPETEPGLLAASLLAADMSGLQLAGLATRGAERQTQITWRAAPPAAAPPRSRQQRIQIARTAARRILQQRGEPTPYIFLQAAALRDLAQKQTLTLPDQRPGEAYTAVRDLCEQAFTYRGGFLRYGGSPHSPEAGRWWVESPANVQPPLADRVESKLLAYLSQHPASTLAEVDAAMCAAFPGLLTPEHELVCACLDSYGQPDAAGRYRLREQEQPEQRAADVAEMQAILLEVGERLGYRTQAGPGVVWSSPSGEIARFVIRSSAVLGEIVYQNRPLPRWAFIVVPGSRANLVAYKLRHDPRLAQAVEGRWRFLKFRLLRRLAEIPLLTRETLDEQFSLDPLTYESPQMRLL